MKNNFQSNTMSKTVFKVKTNLLLLPAILILMSLGFNGKGYGQTTLFQFTFENTLIPVIDNTVGVPAFSSSGVGSLNFNPTTPCEGLTMYQGSYWTIGDYYQFTVNTTGFTGLTFTYCERGSNALMGTFLVRVSPDGSNWTTLLTDYVPDLVNTTKTTPTFPASCENAPTVYIQILKTTEPGSTGRSLRLDNAILTGTQETSPPVANFVPSDGSAGVLVNVNPTITFNEPVQNVDGTPITNSNVASLITFKTTNVSGTDVPFAASIDATGKIITVTPSALMSFSQQYYLAVAAVEDVSGNEAGAQSTSFTTMANTISNDATLSDLKVNGITVAGFAPTTFNYQIVLNYGSPVVPVTTATPTFGLATVLITPTSTLPGTTTILVTAQDGTTQLTYTVEFLYAPASTNSALSYIKWLPNGFDPVKQNIRVMGFSPTTFNYSIEVPSETNSLVVDAEPDFVIPAAGCPPATYVVTQPLNLTGSTAERTATVVCTAQDGTSVSTYYVTFSKASATNFFVIKEGFNAMPPPGWANTANVGSSPANGMGFYGSLSGYLTPKFKWLSPTDGGTLVTPACNGATTLEFFIKVLDKNPASNLHLYIEKSYDSTNWVLVSQDPMPLTVSTTQWHQVMLPVNDISPQIYFRFRATATTGDNSTGLFYLDDVSITANAAFDASLSDLKVNGTTVSGFNPEVLDYDVVLPIGTIVIPAVTATALQPAATVLVTNASALPGTTSVLVTAPDGITVRTYHVIFSYALEAPFNLTANITSATQNNLNWSDNNVSETGFKIERKPDNGLFAVVGTEGANASANVNTMPGLDPNVFIPADRFTNVTVTSGVKFADVINYKGVPTPLYLDVYEPTGDNTLGRPVIIWIHGGGFRTDSYRTQGYIVDYSTRFAKRGYVCMSIDYRLRSGTDMPTQASEFPALQDAARDANAAISWIKANAATYNIDPNLIFIAGGSAGGRTAQTVCQFDGPDPTAVYPPENQYVSTPWNKTGLIANATLWGGLEPEMRGWVYPSPPYSTANYLQATDVPTVLVHGDADVTILPQNSIDLHNALLAAGVTSELHIVPGATHSCLGKETEISAWLATFFAQEWSKVNAKPKSYAYRICAYNASGNSPYSNEVTVSRTLNLNLFLQGLYTGSGAMRKAQGNSGNQFSGNTADQLTVELHNSSTYGTVIHSIPNVNLSVTGSATVSIPASLGGSYYVTIKHRNSIATVSASPVSFASGITGYAFDIPAKAFGNKLFPLGSGIYAIYGGDTNQDGKVDSADMTTVSSDSNAFVTGYIATDVNGDGVIDAADMIIVDNNSSNFITGSTP
ncbi:MAG: alpha/beta hydrolase fold domain-containing protein [Bacteroidales bacterium]